MTIRGKIAAGTGLLMLGGAIVSPTGQAYLGEFFGGAKTTVEKNGPDLAETLKGLGSTASGALPDGLVEVMPDRQVDPATGAATNTSLQPSK